MPPQSLKIDHARYVLTLDRQRRIIQDGAVLVENGRISRVAVADDSIGVRWIVSRPSSPTRAPTG